MSLKDKIKYRKDFLCLKKQAKNSAVNFPFAKRYPCLKDWRAPSGDASGHYFHQDLFVAQRIFENEPAKHVDVGSRVDGFVAHVAAYRKIEVFDVRPQENKINNIIFKQADFMAKDFNLNNYCDSISSLHAIEHFGLGRYGDPVNFDGHLIGLKNIHATLKKNGIFYFSVPIGSQRIEFNAHRVFSLQYLVEIIKDKFIINSFSFVDDKGGFHHNEELSADNIATNFSCHYGCGIFILTKIA